MKNSCLVQEFFYTSHKYLAPCLYNIMIAIFGKGKIGEPLVKLLQHFGIEAQSIDYNEWDEKLFETAEQIIVHQAVKPDADIYTKYGSKTISELNFIGLLLKKQSW